MQLETSKSIFPTEECLLCPVCGFYYIHPLCVKVATGKKLTAIDSEGLTIIRGLQKKHVTLSTKEAQESFWNMFAKVHIMAI